MRSSPGGKLWFVLMVCAVLLAYASVGFGLTQKSVGTVTPDDVQDWDSSWQDEGARHDAWYKSASATTFDDILLGYNDGKFVTTIYSGASENRVWLANAWDTVFVQESGYDVDNAHESLRMWYAIGPYYANGVFTCHYWIPASGYNASDSWVWSSYVFGNTGTGWRTITFQDEDIEDWGDTPYTYDFPWTTDAQRHALNVTVWGYHDYSGTTGGFSIESVRLRWYVWE